MGFLVLEKVQSNHAQVLQQSETPIETEIELPSNIK